MSNDEGQRVDSGPMNTVPDRLPRNRAHRRRFRGSCLVRVWFRGLRPESVQPLAGRVAASAARSGREGGLVVGVPRQVVTDSKGPSAGG